MIEKGEGNPCKANIKGRSGEAHQDAWQTHPRKPRRAAPGSRRPARARKHGPESQDAAHIPGSPSRGSPPRARRPGPREPDRRPPRSSRRHPLCSTARCEFVKLIHFVVVVLVSVFSRFKSEGEGSMMK